MEARIKIHLDSICNAVISNFTKSVSHESKTYYLKLTNKQADIVKDEINVVLHALQLSKTQQFILNNLDQNQFKKFFKNLVGDLSFNQNFSLFEKDKHVKNNGLTGIYYNHLIFALNEFKDEKFWNFWLLKPFGGATPPAKDLKTRINMSEINQRKELIIGVFCKALADFGSHQDHLNLARELQAPNNQMIAAMREPYGYLSFMSSAKEINSKAYFDYQRHLFFVLLGAEVVCSTLNDKNLPLDVCNEIRFFLKPKDIKSMACINKFLVKTMDEKQKKVETTYFRKRI